MSSTSTCRCSPAATSARRSNHDSTIPYTLLLAPGLLIDRVYLGYWFWGRPSAYRLWEDLGDLLRRIKDDFDPTTPEARAAWEPSS